MFTKRVFRTPPLIAFALMQWATDLGRNLKHQGNALHNAVVDDTFVAQPETNDGKVQVPPDFVPAADHDAAIVRANALRPLIVEHMKDGTYAHNAADLANAALIIAPDATDITTLSALLVQYRTALNQHLVNTAPHNRIILAPSVVTMPVDEATNVQVVNTILLLLESHLFSAVVSLELTGT